MTNVLLFGLFISPRKAHTRRRSAAAETMDATAPPKLAYSDDLRLIEKIDELITKARSYLDANPNTRACQQQLAWQCDKEAIDQLKDSVNELIERTLLRTPQSLTYSIVEVIHQNNETHLTIEFTRKPQEVI